MAEWINDPQGREEIEKVTKELKLPVWKANHKGKFRDFWNELWDKIEDYILKLKGDTEKNSKGLNDRLVSAVGKHDGDFPIENAVVGNVYYSELTKKYYKCKVGGPAPMPNGNFVDMSILENLNRLENLDKNLLYKIDRWSPKDEDELVKTGIFQIKGATSKLKRGFCGSQCFVLVFNTSVNGDDYVTQIAFSYYDTFSIAIRTRNGGTKQWAPWRYLSAN